MTLHDFLDAQARGRFVWGESDCVQFGLAWARERTGRPLAPLFDYQSRAEAQRALRARGGLERIVRDWMGRHGFASTLEPEDGDIGLAPFPSNAEDAVAGGAIVIRCGPWWIGKSPKGISSVTATGIPAWRIA